jgi:hypothetical protein
MALGSIRRFLSCDIYLLGSSPFQSSLNHSVAIISQSDHRSELAYRRIPKSLGARIWRNSSGLAFQTIQEGSWCCSTRWLSSYLCFTKGKGGASLATRHCYTFLTGAILFAYALWDIGQKGDS